MSGLLSGAASMLGFGGTTTLGASSASTMAMPRANAPRMPMKRLSNANSHAEVLPTAPMMRNSASASLPAAASGSLVGGYRKKHKKSKKAKKSKKTKKVKRSHSRRNRD